jgi:hypothetical protein
MNNRAPFACLALFLLATSGRATPTFTGAYDVERDIGLVAGDDSPAVATRNTERLNAALEAQCEYGQFKFASGRTGPVLKPITCAAKEFYFAGTIQTAKRNGGVLCGYGSRGYPLPTEQYSGPVLGGAVTRFTRIDLPSEAGDKKTGAIIRLRGSGFTLTGIEFRGRPYKTDSTGLGPQEGQRTAVGIEIEGRTAPATGWHDIHNCGIAECVVGVCVKAGYYDADGTFVAEENHGDNFTMERIHFWQCDVCYRSECQQAIVISLRDIAVGGWGGKSLRPIVVCDMHRGGNLWIDGLAVNHPQATLFRVHDWNPFAANLICRNLFRDYFGEEHATDYYITLFEYAGPVYKDAPHNWLHWRVRIDGILSSGTDKAGMPKPAFDVNRLIVVPKEARGFPLDNIRLDIAGLPRVVPGLGVKTQ